MSITGYIAGGQVPCRRAVKFDAAGKIVVCAAADKTPAAGVMGPPVGIAQAWGRGAAGTPWQKVFTGASAPAAGLTQNVTPIAAELEDEIHVWDKDGQECEAECGTPTLAAGSGGPIVYGDKLTVTDGGLLVKLSGAGYYVAVALFDAVEANPITTANTVIGMVRIEKGLRSA